MKKALSILLILVMVFTLAACGGNDDGKGSAEGEKIVISIGHTDSSSRSTNVAGEWLNDYLSEKTDGRITVQMYPDGQAGDDPDIAAGVPSAALLKQT